MVIGDRIWRIIFFTLTFLFVLTLQAQKSNSVTITLQEITLKSTKTITPRNKLPFSVTAQDISLFQKTYQ